MLIPGKRSQGLIITCLIGIAGALLGGWLATKLFHIHTLHGFFNLSTWLTAIAGAAALLLAYHLVTARSSGRSGSGRFGRWGTPMTVADRPGPPAVAGDAASTRTSRQCETTGGRPPLAPEERAPGETNHDRLGSCPPPVAGRRFRVRHPHAAVPASLCGHVRLIGPHPE